MLEYDIIGYFLKGGQPMRTGRPERIEKNRFPFSRLRAEALRRASTGMTKKDDYGVLGQKLSYGKRWTH
jgi:hypothetical protein